MRSRRRINKIIFNKKTDKKVLEPAKRELELIADAGNQKFKLSAGKLGIAATCLLVTVCLFFVVYIYAIKDPISNPPPQELEEIYFNESDLDFDKIDVDELPADFHKIVSPQSHEIKKFYKDETAVYYELNYEYMDELNFDSVTLLIQRSHVHLDTIDSFNFSEEMEYKGKKILYQKSERQEFCTFKAKVEIDKVVYYLKTITVTPERFYYYLDQIL